MRSRFEKTTLEEHRSADELTRPRHRTPSIRSLLRYPRKGRDAPAIAVLTDALAVGRVADAAPCLDGVAPAAKPRLAVDELVLQLVPVAEPSASR